jgi:hypothetical protein
MTTSNVSSVEKKISPKRTTKRTTTTKRSSPEKVMEVSLDLPLNPFVFEVFSLVDKVTSNEKKIEVLKKFEHPSLKSIFIWNFDDNVLSMLPEGEVPYSTAGEDLIKTGTVSDHINREVEKMKFYDSNSVGYTEKIRTGHTCLRTEYDKLINFVKSRSGVPGNSNLTSLRRESMFIEMLQGLHPLDAEIMCLTKDKKLQTKYNITKKLVSEAYPDIQWEVNR